MSKPDRFHQANGLHVKLEQWVPKYPTDRVHVSFDGKRWHHIGYMSQRPGTPFNGLWAWNDLAEDDQAEVQQILNTMKGEEVRCNSPKKNPPQEFLAESS